MADLDPAQVEKIERMAAAAAAAASAMEANTKTQKSQLRLELEHEQAIRSLTKAFMKTKGLSEEEAKLRARALKAEEDLISATARQKEASNKAAEAQQKIVNMVRTIAGGVANFAKSAANASNSIYNSNKAFTAVSPTLQLVGHTVNQMIEAFGKMLSGVSAFGFSLGKAPEGLAALAGAAVQVAFSLAQMKLERAQKYVDAYGELTRAGMSFGGQIENMRKIALSGTMSLDSFQNYVKASAKELVILGGNIETGAERALKFGTAVTKGNDRLLTMYGSFEALQGATTDFMNQLAQAGVDTRTMTARQTKQAEQYLFQQKELSALTGKSVEQLKKEQDERMKHAAFLDAMAEKQARGGDDYINTQRAMAVVEKLKGDEGRKYLEELISSNGNITSTAMLRFQSLNSETAATIRQIFDSTGLKTDQYKKQEAEILKNRLPLELKQSESTKQLYAVSGALTEQNSDYYNTVEKNRVALLNSVTAVNDLSYATNLTADNINKPLSETGKTFADTLKDLNTYKIRIDALTESQLGATGALVKELYQVQTNLDHILGDNSTLGKAMDWLVKKSVEAANALSGITAAVTGGETEAPSLVVDAMGNITGVTSEPASVSASPTTGPGKNNQLNQSGKKLGPPTYEKDLIAAGLKIKSGDVQAPGAEVNPALIQLAKRIQETVPGFVAFNGFNDRFHHLLPYSSSHTNGLALDFALARKPTDEEGRALIAQIKELGATKVIDEYNHPSMFSTGGHIHAEVSAADGAMVNGPASGYPATLHGNELIVPLNKHTVFDDILNKLGDLLDAIKDNNYTSEKILSATQ